MEQRSPEWFAERIGRITSTSAKVIVNPRATAAGRDSLRGELVSEIATASFKHVPETFWMRHGTTYEPYAIAAYELEKGTHVAAGTFQVSDYNDLLGDSPDGVIGLGEGCLEAKCPNSENHGAVLATGEPYDSSYVWQMFWHLLVGGYEWCDFVSYHPDYPEHLRLFIRRYTMADIFPEKLIKGKKFKTKDDTPDKIITTEEQVNFAGLAIQTFIDDYQATLVRLGLTLE